MKLEVYNINGNTTGKSVDLPAEIFGVEPNEHAVYLAVKQYRAAQRQGTHKAKEKGEITASTRKIKRQKGTGTARAGSLKSPLFRGGGRVFGPRPRSYDIQVNKKVKSIARASALSHRASSGAIKIVEDFTFDAPKTKQFREVLSNLSLEGTKSLFVTGDAGETNNVYLSARNIQGTNVVPASRLNTYEILNANQVIISESGLNKLKEFYAK